MRKLAFIKSSHPIRKIIIYETHEIVHLFLYDSVDDRACIADFTFNMIESADIYCKETYGVDKTNWIHISDPLPGCQVDFIKPTRLKGRDADDPLWGRFQYLNGKLVDLSPSGKYSNFNGLSGNECLFVAGLLDEFDHAKKTEPSKAFKILSDLGLSVETIFTLIPQ